MTPEERDLYYETEGELNAATYRRQRRLEAEARQAALDRRRTAAEDRIASLLGNLNRLRAFKRAAERARVSAAEERERKAAQAAQEAEEAKARAAAEQKERGREEERRELAAAGGGLWGSRTNNQEHWAFKYGRRARVAHLASRVTHTVTCQRPAR